MATCCFRSALAFRLQSFWETRAASGRGPFLLKVLRYLDQFLIGELQPGDTITREVTERYFKSTEHLAPGTRINRMSILRQFCLYQSHFDSRTCIVHRMFLPRRNRPMPHIYTRDEVRRIMAAAPASGCSPDPLRPVVFATLVGFLYATGLRVGEAMKLDLADVDLRRQLVLIRQTKFGKTRYVPLAPCTTRQLAAYAAKRRAAGFSQESTAPFFPSALGGRYHLPSFTTVFLQVLRRLGLRGPPGQRGPRIHDLRHSFAVSRLMAWHKSGDNLFAKLPILSTYLGAQHGDRDRDLSARHRRADGVGGPAFPRALRGAIGPSLMSAPDLPALIRGFFDQHLVSQRGLSGHTVLSYRDTFKLLLKFASDDSGKRVTELTLADLTAELVHGFLRHLEADRHNGIVTRNLRLAAIHSFFRYLAIIDPRHLTHAHSIIAVPFKRRPHRVAQFLEKDEVQEVFRQIDCRTLFGQRDDALLRMLYNTGMRAQELVDLDVRHVRLTRPSSVLIFGKSRKERTCPLWPETVSAVKSYLQTRSIKFTDAVPLFLNSDGNRLTRYGVRYIVSHRIGKAAQRCPTLLARRISPHTWRHTTAMHLLQSNVDLAMIRSWLGHASIETTNTYVEIDLEMKRKTLASAEKILPKPKRPFPWRANNDVLAWLSTL